MLGSILWREEGGRGRVRGEVRVKGEGRGWGGGGGGEWGGWIISNMAICQLVRHVYTVRKCHLKRLI